MVEINNQQRKAFLDMLAGRRELITDVRNQKSWLWRHCRRSAIYWLLRSPLQTCHAKPKTQINRRRTLPALSRWWDAYRKQLGLKDFSPKSQDAVALQQIKERGALPMIDRGDIRQAIDRCSNIWASLPGAGYGQFEHKADSLIAKFKEARERSERLMYEQSHRDYLRSGYLHHRLPVNGLLIITDNAITLQSPARQKCQRISRRTRQLLTCRCVSVMLLRSMQNTRRS